MSKGEVLHEAVTLLSESAKHAPRLEGVPTGVEGLDELFFMTEWRDDKPVQRPLGGIPRYAVLQVTGVSDTGKSLMVEQFTVEQARRGTPCVFLSTESPAPFVAMGLRARATAMGVDFATIEERIVLLDAASHPVLAQDLPTLFNTLAYALKTYHVKAVVIDSLTGLYEARELLAREVVRPVYSFLKSSITGQPKRLPSSSDFRAQRCAPCYEHRLRQLWSVSRGRNPRRTTCTSPEAWPGWPTRRCAARRARPGREFAALES